MFGKGVNAKLKIAATVVAGLGAYLMGYLTRLHFKDAGGDSICDISAELSCDIVNKSLYSEILGVPVAVLGLLFFLSIPYLLYVKPLKKPWRAVLLFSVFSLVFGLYLSALEQFVIGSICLFCETSKLLMLALLGIAAYAVKHEKEELPKQWIVGAVLVGLVFSGAAYMLQKPPAPKADYTALAQCLTESGVHMYGAFGCTHCATQKRDLGAAFSEISYIECDPRGEDNQSERCIARNIPGTPTWIQETSEGEVLHTVVGAQSPERLAEEFGCEDSLVTPLE